MCIKDFLEMGFQGKDVVTIVLSGAAFTISFFNYRRDNGQLLLSVNTGQIVSLGDTKNTEDALFISITNTGRRNVFVKSIIFNQSNILKRMLQYFCPEKVKANYAMLTPSSSSAQISSVLFDANYSPKKYGEGESQNTTISLADEKSRKAFLDLFTKSKSMFVEDTTGKKHYLSCREYRAVIFSLKRMV